MIDLQLVVTRGLPASGKTTRALEWVAASANRARVNRDDLRQQLFGRDAPLPYELEEQVTKAETAMVEALLRSGTSVIVDATHLKAKYLKRWVAMAEKFGAEFTVLDLTDVTLEECIQRDTDRHYAGQRSVGQEVIRDMHARLKSQRGALDLTVTAPDPYVYEPNEALLPAWIFDIDGTLALMDGRSPYDTRRAGEDLKCEGVNLVKQALQVNYRILVVSGREEAYREITEDWFRRHHIAANDLFMRKTGDTREDSIIKLEIFRNDIAPNYRVLGVFDDRDRVVEMWRRIGLQCFQVAPGDF
jgi:predicted kinase